MKTLVFINIEIINVCACVCVCVYQGCNVPLDGCAISSLGEQQELFLGGRQNIVGRQHKRFSISAQLLFGADQVFFRLRFRHDDDAWKRGTVTRPLRNVTSSKQKLNKTRQPVCTVNIIFFSFYVFFYFTSRKRTEPIFHTRLRT